MKALSGHTGAISMIVRGKAGDQSRLAKHAEALANLGAEVEAVFQEGSDIEDSEALQAIWGEPDEFADAVANLETAIATLSDVAGGGDMQATDSAFREVGKACKGCHERFRIQDD